MRLADSVCLLTAHSIFRQTLPLAVAAGLPWGALRAYLASRGVHRMVARPSLLKAGCVSIAGAFALLLSDDAFMGLRKEIVKGHLDISFGLQVGKL